MPSSRKVKTPMSEFSLRDFCEPGDTYVDFGAGTREVITEEYDDHQWDGNDAVIESGTNPWIQDEDGNVFDFGGEALREVTPGVLVYGTEIQRDDSYGVYSTDLIAAEAAAHLVEYITGKPWMVWYRGAA